MLKAFLQSRIRNKLGGYSITINEVDPSKPASVSPAKRVAVVGAGLAGIGAASLLAERGFAVALFERNSYIGGKVGSWDVAFANGYATRVDHGFHAFFRHYYNLRAFMEKTRGNPTLQTIDDYLVLASDGKQYSFKDVATTPVLNILSLGRNKFFRFRDVLFNRPKLENGRVFGIRRSKTFAKYDGMTFAEFASEAQLPSALKLTFNTFARAFFAPAEKLSAAELMKSFHFFYLSHDHGLLYDYFHYRLSRRTARTHPYASCALQCLGSLKPTRRGTFAVKKKGSSSDPRMFDYLIVASDVTGTKNICKNSPWIESESAKPGRN